MDEAHGAYGNVAYRVEIQLVHAGTLGTQPEELRVIGSPLKCIEIAAIEKLELFTAGWVDAPFEHSRKPRNNLYKDY
jgi:hypothetical protein